MKGGGGLKHKTIPDCEINPVFDLAAFSIGEFYRYKVLMLIKVVECIKKVVDVDRDLLKLIDFYCMNFAPNRFPYI